MRAGDDGPSHRPALTDVRELLDACIERNVVGRNETMIALVNGQPYSRVTSRIHRFDWTSSRSGDVWPPRATPSLPPSRRSWRCAVRHGARGLAVRSGYRRVRDRCLPRPRTRRDQQGDMDLRRRCIRHARPRRDRRPVDGRPGPRPIRLVRLTAQQSPQRTCPGGSR